MSSALIGGDPVSLGPQRGLLWPLHDPVTLPEVFRFLSNLWDTLELPPYHCHCPEGDGRPGAGPGSQA